MLLLLFLRVVESYLGYKQFSHLLSLLSLSNSLSLYVSCRKSNGPSQNAIEKSLNKGKNRKQQRQESREEEDVSLVKRVRQTEVSETLDQRQQATQNLNYTNYNLRENRKVRTEELQLLMTLYSDPADIEKVKKQIIDLLLNPLVFAETEEHNIEGSRFR